MVETYLCKGQASGDLRQCAWCGQGHHRYPFGGLSELGKMDRKKIAALVGVAPMNYDGGRKRGYRKTKGGRADVRRVLYMSTLVATRHNPLIQTQYQQM